MFLYIASLRYFPHVLHLGNNRLEINGRPVSICCLFRESEDFDQTVFENLCSAMGQMHLHNVFPQNDTLHRSIALVIQRAHGDTALLIKYLSFFFEFSYLTQYETNPHKLKRCAEMGAKEFGEYCLLKEIVPITPRFGQGDGPKSWFKQLLKAIEETKPEDFVGKIVSVHQTRVLT